MQSRPGRIVCICDVSNGSDGGGDDNHHNLLSHKYYCLLHLFIVYQHHANANPYTFSIPHSLEHGHRNTDSEWLKINQSSYWQETF